MFKLLSKYQNLNSKSGIITEKLKKLGWTRRHNLSIGELDFCKTFTQLHVKIEVKYRVNYMYIQFILTDWRKKEDQENFKE